MFMIPSMICLRLLSFMSGIHMGSVPFAMETLLTKFEEDMHPGDLFILNDPFDGGMHIPDIFIINLLRQHDGEKTLNVMVSSTIQEGETLYHRQAGGGGFGLPWEREPPAVAEDVRNEKVSRTAAREDYGVALVEGCFEVDTRQTAELRRHMCTS